MELSPLLREVESAAERLIHAAATPSFAIQAAAVVPKAIVAEAESVVVGATPEIAVSAPVNTTGFGPVKSVAVLPSASRARTVIIWLSPAI